MNCFSVSGRAFVVTGGAGHLGRHICHGLASAGASVLCLSSRELYMGEVGPPGIEFRVCDVCDESAVESALAEFAGGHGRLDGLVNAAGRGRRGIDLDMPAADLNAGINAIATHFFTSGRSAAKHMSGGGSIVNLVSMWGALAPDFSTYLDLKNEPSPATAAGAGAILGMTRYLAAALAPKAIRVNALMPGWFPRQRGPQRPDYMAEIEKRVPLGRIGRPEELVGSIIYLLSQASSYVTGQTLVVDGGYTVR